jgi:tRNA pseudouridine(38-40) synthase
MTTATTTFMLIVAYDGTRFHGFQRQIDSATLMAKRRANQMERPKKRPHTNETTGVRKGCNLSIQEVLEMVLLDLFSNLSSVDDIGLKFAGRTDKGVHANGQVCVVNLPLDSGIAQPLSIRDASLHCWKLRKDINSRLPVDVSVQSVKLLVHMGVHYRDLDPRRDAKRKRYTYTIKYRRRRPASNTDSANDNPSIRSETTDQSVSLFPTELDSPHTIRHAFDAPNVWICPWSVDDARFTELCAALAGTHDYTNFVHKADRFKKNQTLTVDRMEFEILGTIEENMDGMKGASSHGSFSPTENANGSDATAASAAYTTFTSAIVTGQFTFEAAGFRRTMLRNLVGYCVDVGRGLESAPSVDNVFDSSDSDVSSRINAAPAVGLCLESVTY